MSASSPETMLDSVCLIIALIIDACSRVQRQPAEPELLDRGYQSGEGRAKTLSLVLHM